MLPRTCLAVGLLVSVLGTFIETPFAAAGRRAAPLAALSPEAWSGASLGTLAPEVFGLALTAAGCAMRSGDVADIATLTIIDYSRPSTEKRLWVFDLRTRALLFEELVAHGQGSGDKFATSFSNQPDSHQSSLGLFRTEEAYLGKNGYSLRLQGLDAGFNDQAYARAIVMHGAPYVSEEFASAQGRLGRSWGCPAVRQGVAREVIDTVKGHGLVFAYYPDTAWLSASKYLRDCGRGPAGHLMVAGL